jgi:hypothetical protein
MGKQGAEIMEGDDEYDIASFFMDVCGVDSEFDITRELWEENLDQIVDIVKENSFRNVVYLIFGYFTLKLGATLPPYLRPKMLEAANWENEKDCWPEKEYALMRRFYLKDFQQKVRNYKPGKATHLIFLKNRYKDLTDGVVGLDQFWDYVFSKKAFSVKYVNLDSCDLEDIPAPVFDLVDLKSLSLEHNQIKEVPYEIGKLKTLKEMYLNDNQIFKLPESFGNLSSLKTLYLIKNKLTALPEAMSNLSSLEAIFLNDNELKELPKSILEIKSLKEVYCMNNRIKERPSYLKNAPFSCTK